MPAPTFGPIPPSLWDDNPPVKSSTAQQNLRALNQYIRGHRGHAHGSWGYTVLRTAYTPESDVLVPVALDGLKRYVHWWCHHGRFPAFGALCEEQRVDFSEPNDELFRRFYLEVVEDREGLAHLDGGGGGGDGVANGDERFAALGDYFRRRVVAGVADTGDCPEDNPRFCVCLVLDSESVASLVRLPEQPPPLRCAADLAEKREFLAAGQAGLWILEADYREEQDSDDEDYYGPDDTYRGWMRIGVPEIMGSWFSRLQRDSAPYFWHEQKEQGSVVYWYADLPPL